MHIFVFFYVFFGHVVKFKTCKVSKRLPDKEKPKKKKKESVECASDMTKKKRNNHFRILCNYEAVAFPGAAVARICLVAKKPTRLKINQSACARMT